MLFMYEYEAFQRFIDKYNPIKNETARQSLWRLSCCTRYIDDLWNPLVNESFFKKFTEKMYPEYLPIGDPEYKGRKIHYLDMTIFHKYGLWQSKLYDKRVDLQQKGLKVNCFPDQQTRLTDKCKYGIITSQLHRYAVACTRSKDFIGAATQLYGAFIKKKYNRRTINQYVGRFMRRSMPHLKTGVIWKNYERLTNTSHQ